MSEQIEYAIVAEHRTFHPATSEFFDWISPAASGQFPDRCLAESQLPAETELAAKVESFELAYRMQMAAPEALDLARESEPTQKLYGLDNPKCAHFAKQCLTDVWSNEA